MKKIISVVCVATYIALLIFSGPVASDETPLTIFALYGHVTFENGTDCREVNVTVVDAYGDSINTTTYENNYGDWIYTIYLDDPPSDPKTTHPGFTNGYYSGEVFSVICDFNVTEANGTVTRYRGTASAQLPEWGPSEVPPVDELMQDLTVQTYVPAAEAAAADEEPGAGPGGDGDLTWLLLIIAIVVVLAAAGFAASRLRKKEE